MSCFVNAFCFGYQLSLGVVTFYLSNVQYGEVAAALPGQDEGLDDVAIRSLRECFFFLKRNLSITCAAWFLHPLQM